MDFRGLDLNLLVAFDALMHERNVTRAATRAAVSQPAMSAALSRLRTQFSDPLFIRSASGLLPTVQAKEIGLHVSKALHELTNLVAPAEGFSPDISTLSFTLGMSEYPMMVLLPEIMRAINQQAPGVTIHIRTFIDRDESVTLLDTGKIDMVMGIAPTQPENRILSLPLFTDEFVTLIRGDNEAATQGMTLEKYLAMSHILVSPEGNHFGLVDERLRERGLGRKVRLTLPTMSAVSSVVHHTNYVATVLKRSVLVSDRSESIVMVKPPLDMPEIQCQLFWHRRSDDSNAQKWLRKLIVTVAGNLV